MEYYVTIVLEREREREGGGWVGGYAIKNKERKKERNYLNQTHQSQQTKYHLRLPELTF